jgi:hypothetical protein
MLDQGLISLELKDHHLAKSTLPNNFTHKITSRTAIENLVA